MRFNSTFIKSNAKMKKTGSINRNQTYMLFADLQLLKLSRSDVVLVVGIVLHLDTTDSTDALTIIVFEGKDTELKMDSEILVGQTTFDFIFVLLAG